MGGRPLDMKGQLGGDGCRSARMYGVIAQRDVDQLCSGKGGIDRGLCDDTPAGCGFFREEKSRGAVGTDAAHLVATDDPSGWRASVGGSGAPLHFQAASPGAAQQAAT